MRMVIKIFGLLTLMTCITACSTVESSGEAVQSVGNGAGQVISGVGEAVGDAGQAIGEGAGEIVSGTGRAISRGAEKTERKGY